MEVIVEDAQLSLAIGKKGQNVRLAAKLMGWKIDIKTEEEKRQEVEATMDSMAATPLSMLLTYGLSESVLDTLLAGGVATVERVGAMTPEELESIEGVSAEMINEVVVAVNAYYGQPYAAQAEAPVMETEAAAEEAAPVVEAEAAAPEVEAEEAAPETAAPEDSADEPPVVEVEPEGAASEAPAGEEAGLAAGESGTMGSSGLVVEQS